jgi:hypothetical protein
MALTIWELFHLFWHTQVCMTALPLLKVGPGGKLESNRSFASLGNLG